MFIKRKLAMFLSLAMTVTSITTMNISPSGLIAAGKKVTLNEGQKKNITLGSQKAFKKAKLQNKSKAVVGASVAKKKGKFVLTLTGKKAGKGTLNVVLKKKKKGSVKKSFNVVVKAADKDKPTGNIPANSAAPAVSAAPTGGNTMSASPVVPSGTTAPSKETIAPNPETTAKAAEKATTKPESSETTQKPDTPKATVAPIPEETPYPEPLTDDVTDIICTKKFEFTGYPCIVDLANQIPSKFNLALYSNVEMTYEVTWKDDASKKNWVSGKFAVADDDSLDGYSEGLVSISNMKGTSGTATIKFSKKLEGRIAGLNIQPMNSSYSWPDGLQKLTVTQIKFTAREGAKFSDVSQEDPVIVYPDDLNNYASPKNYKTRLRSVQYATKQEITYPSKTVGTDRKAVIYLPPNYDESKKYPILFLLHGIGGTENEWTDGKPNEIVYNLVAQGKTKEMIMVQPNVRARVNDHDVSDIYQKTNTDAFDNFINDLRDDLLPYMKKNYSVADGRENTAICGLSMGGRESLYIGTKMPDTFGYIGAFEPAPGLLEMFSDKTELKLPDQYNGLDKTFVLVVKGKQDTTVNDNPLIYHNTLTENGTDHVYYEIEGGHEFKVWSNALYNFARRIFQK